MKTFLFSENTADSTLPNSEVAAGNDTTTMPRPLGLRILEISDESRSTLARHFEDQVAPALISSMMRARNIAIQLFLDSHPKQGEADLLVGTLSETYAYADQIIRQQLGPDVAEDLVPALADLARRIHCIYHLQCYFQQAGPAPQVTSGETMNIYRFASEIIALCQQRKAGMILLRLDTTETASGHISLRVIDDGAPLGERADDGLRSLALRASMSQANLESSLTDDGLNQITCHFLSEQP